MQFTFDFSQKIVSSIGRWNRRDGRVKMTILIDRYPCSLTDDRQVPGEPKVGYTQLYGAPSVAGVSILSV